MDINEGQCEVPLGIGKPTVHGESRTQCVAWCFSKVCQEAELLWTLDPSLGPMFIICWVRSQVPRCPEMMVRGPVGSGLASWLWGVLDFTGGSWQRGALTFLTS